LFVPPPPPRGGGFLFTMFPEQELCVRDVTMRCDHTCIDQYINTYRYMHIYICVNTCVHYAWIHVCIHPYTWMYAQIKTRYGIVHDIVRVYTYTDLHMYIYTDLHIYIHGYVHQIHIHTYTDVRIHRYIHIQIYKICRNVKYRFIQTNTNK